METWVIYTTADDFMTDPVFRHWVTSGEFGQAGHPYTQFLINHAHLQPLAQQAADLIRVTALPQEALSSQELARHVEVTWQKIRLEENAIPVRPLWRVWRWVAAAMVLLVGGLTWWVNRPASIDPVLAANWQLTTNQQTKIRPLSLSDGSVVWLAPGSSIRYPKQFMANRRDVFLTGEAFFEIHKNARQPFYVKTPHLLTRVVGTSFLVKVQPDNAETMVQVRTGQVVVYDINATNASARPVVLLANQQVRVTSKPKILLPELVKKPSTLSERLNNQRFEFTDASVSTILNALSTAYDMPVDYNRNTFKNCVITTALTDESLTEKLAILAETIGPDTRAELIGNHIRLTGSGCP